MIFLELVIDIVFSVSSVGFGFLVWLLILFYDLNDYNFDALIMLYIVSVLSSNYLGRISLRLSKWIMLIYLFCYYVYLRLGIIFFKKHYFECVIDVEDIEEFLCVSPFICSNIIQLLEIEDLEPVDNLFSTTLTGLFSLYFTFSSVASIWCSKRVSSTACNIRNE